MNQKKERKKERKEKKWKEKVASRIELLETCFIIITIIIIIFKL